MKILKSFVLAFLMLVTAGAYANASDLLYVPKAPKPQYVNTGAGPYVQIHGGFDKSGNITGNVSPTTGGTADFSTGYNFGGGFGWAFDSWGYVRPRLEVEANYLKNDINTLQIFNAGGPVGAPLTNITGDYSAIYGLANALFDIETGTAFTPYFGGGIGYGQVDLNAAAPAPIGTFINDSDGSFAWSLQAGITYSITENTKFDLGYKFVRFQDVQLQGTPPLTVGQDIDNHQVNAGFRIKL